MNESQRPLRNQWFAAVLAYLIPGAGHLYQGRMFKSVLYAVCILGTFLYGMSMAEWKAVYYQSENPAQGRKRTYGYFAQLGVGLPALFAYGQYRRYNQPGNEQTNKLDAPLEAPFQGTMTIQYSDGRVDDKSEVSGQIHLEPLAGGFEIEGQFIGTDSRGQPVDVKLKGPLELGPPLAASRQRQLDVNILDTDRNFEGAELEGWIPRRFVDWFSIPLDNPEVESLSGRLGKNYELALVFTWIAGLLNVLAVWDALEGPAYGNGDEDEDESDRASPDKSPPKEAVKA